MIQVWSRSVSIKRGGNNVYKLYYKCEVREDTGKGASRRLRRLTGEVPAIIYGGKKDAEKISILHKDITKALENDRLVQVSLSLNRWKSRGYNHKGYSKASCETDNSSYGFFKSR